MASLRCSLEGRFFGALLSALKKALFEHNEAFTAEALAESLYADSGLPQDVILAEIQSFEQLLRTAARHDYDVSQIEEVSSNGELSEEQTRILATFWRNERAKIHEKIHKLTVWNNHYKSLNWRVDMKVAQSQSLEEAQELNEPVAIFELASTASLNAAATTTAESPASSSDGVQVARFEMTKDQIANLLEQFANIQTKIDSLA